MGVLKARLYLGLALHQHLEGRARSPGAYLYGFMHRYQAGELTPPPLGAGAVDYTLANGALYLLQKPRTETLLASYDEDVPHRQRALERQQPAAQLGAS